MKATSIVLAFCFGMVICNQSQGQEYFDGPGYLTDYPAQHAQQGFAQEQYAQAEYQQAMAQQAHLVQAQQAQFAQTHPAQPPQLAQAQYT